MGLILASVRVSPLILLALVVYVNHRDDPALADPNFYRTVTDGLRNMVDGEWGYAKIEQSALDGRVIDFISKCNRFMGAWCAKAMGGEGSSARASIVGEDNLLEECMVKRETASVPQFDLSWIMLDGGPYRPQRLHRRRQNQAAVERPPEQPNLRCLQGNLLVRC